MEKFSTLDLYEAFQRKKDKNCKFIPILLRNNWYNLLWGREFNIIIDVKIIFALPPLSCDVGETVKLG